MTENLVTNDVAKDSPNAEVVADQEPADPRQQPADPRQLAADQLNDSAVASVRALEEPGPPDGHHEESHLPAGVLEAGNGRRPGTGDEAPANGGTSGGEGGAAGNEAFASEGGAAGGDSVNGDAGETVSPALLNGETATSLSGPPGGTRRAPTHEQLVAEGDAAGDYLERLLDILDFDGDIDLDVEGERAAVSIIGDSTDIDKLVGERGEVLDALQELTRLAATAETGQRSRLMLDIGGYRARRRTELSALGTLTAREVLDSGEPVRLAPMNPFERKVVHDAVAGVQGVSSSSEGEEPRRRIVVSPETST